MSEDPTERLALLLRKRSLLQKRSALSKGFGLKDYLPHPKQDAFHRAGNRLRRAAFCGNRFGKSHMGCAEDCGWLMGERVWYKKGDPARTIGIPKRPVKGLVITTDWDKVDEIWTTERGTPPGKIWQMLPNGFVKSQKRNHSGAIETIECANGSLLKFDTVKSWMANPQGSESSDWDFIHPDEPLPQLMWKAASRGLVDRGGAAWFTLTALTEPWISDMFIPRGGRVENVEFLDRGQFWMIRGSMWDNPTLSKEAIDMYIATLSKEEIQCRIEGIPLERVGLVYKEFEYDRHVLAQLPAGWASWTKPPTNWPIYLAIDPHPQTPHAVLACTVSPLGQVIFFAEIFKHCTIRELCSMMSMLFQQNQILTCVCDPLAYVNDPITGGNMADEFARWGWVVDKATKALQQGILRVKDDLTQPNRIYLSPYLEETLWEIQRYCWDQKEGRENKPVDKDDHMMENLYRLLLDEPSFVEISEYSSRPVGDLIIDRPNFHLDEEVSLSI